MAARRCDACQIDYPTSVDRCRVCDERADYILAATPDEDWLDRVAVARAQLATSRRTTAELIEDWRLEQLLDAGYDADTAIRIAARHTGPDKVDLHHAVELLAGRGCPAPIAARILL